MSVMMMRFNRPGYETEFQVIKVDDRFHLFWHKRRVGRFLNLKQALSFAEHLGID